MTQEEIVLRGELAEMYLEDAMLVRRTMPMIALSVVVLPTPLRPTRPRKLEASARRLMPCSTGVAP